MKGKYLTSVLFLILYSNLFSQEKVFPPSVFVEELTWSEVDLALKSGYKTIIIPTGGTEQNGPHMALGKHNKRILHGSGEVAKILGDALVAPVLSYVPEGEIDPPGFHMRFAGTITLPEEYYKKVIEFAVRSFKHHGFQFIVLMGDSGGNQKGMEEVANELNTEWSNTDVKVIFASAWYRGSSALPEDQVSEEDLLSEFGFEQKDIGTHAGAFDVSSMIYVDSSYVRFDIVKEHFRNLKDSINTELLGYNGDPTKATFAIGQRLQEIKIKRAANQIKYLKGN